MIRTRADAGIALPLVLGTILLLALIVLAAVAAIQSPTNLLGALGRREDDRIAAESRLEQARALLLTDPDVDLSPIPVTAQWSAIDSCQLAVATAEGQVSIHETWIVSAPTRFTLFVDSGITLSGDAELEGLIHDGAKGCLCETAPIDTTVFDGRITRRITASVIDGLRISNEVIEIIPEDSTVLLSNIEIDHGMILVRGGAVLAGLFTGNADADLPLMIVSGDLGSDVHEEPWLWHGVIGVAGDAFLTGPIDFTGTIVARSVVLFGSTRGVNAAQRPLPGIETRIVIVNHSESMWEL